MKNSEQIFKEIIIVKGAGKGKTTFSLGLLARTFFSGRKGVIIQFMKGYPYSEVSLLQTLPGIRIEQTGTPDFVKRGDPGKIDKSEAQRGLDIAVRLCKSGKLDLMVLDEINVAVDYGLVEEEKVLGFLSSCFSISRIVLTGRYPSSRLISIADRVITMNEIKHPFNSGIMARKGIDF